METMNPVLQGQSDEKKGLCVNQLLYISASAFILSKDLY